MGLGTKKSFGHLPLNRTLLKSQGVPLKKVFLNAFLADTLTSRYRIFPKAVFIDYLKLGDDPSYLMLLLKIPTEIPCFSFFIYAKKLEVESGIAMLLVHPSTLDTLPSEAVSGNNKEWQSLSGVRLLVFIPMTRAIC